MLSPLIVVNAIQASLARAGVDVLKQAPPPENVPGIKLHVTATNTEEDCRELASALGTSLYRKGVRKANIYAEQAPPRGDEEDGMIVTIWRA